MRFDWDPAKAASNVVKHEERMIALGQIDGRVLYVVYADDGDTRWIISVRRATKQESERYYYGED